MGLRHRVFGKPVEPSVTRAAVPGRAGRMTAHQAWEVVVPVAAALDSDPKMTLISSGLDMNHEGRSYSWEFIFFLPGRKATVLFSLEPDRDSPDIDTAPSVLTQRLNPASALEARRPVFPSHFRDSPEVVAELTARGVDWVAGPSDMKLEGRVPSPGEAVWVTYYWDEEVQAAFATS